MSEEILIADLEMPEDRKAEVDALTAGCSALFLALLETSTARGFSVDEQAILAIDTEGPAGQSLLEGAPPPIRELASQARYFAQISRPKALSFVADWSNVDGALKEWEEHCAQAKLFRQVPLLMVLREMVVLALFDVRTKGAPEA